MTQIDAFTLGKKFGQPELNEDCMVILPEIGYAVIDGVTDRNGTRYDNMLSGRYASRTAGRALQQFLLGRGAVRGGAFPIDPEALIALLGNAIHQGYQDNGALAKAEADWKVRAGCAIMIALHEGDDIVVIAVGDSGIRINGSEIVQPLKPLDDVTALLRRETWRHFEAAGASLADCDRLAASITWQGTRNQPTGPDAIAADVIEEIEARALKTCQAHLPDVPEIELLELIHQGIAHGQGNFQNVTDRVLGYGAIDGFAMPARYIETRRYKASEIETLELFSDGYFAPGAEFGVASWEDSFRMVEQQDPHKIDRYLSTKGTTQVQLTDDRTYLGVRLR